MKKILFLISLTTVVLLCSTVAEAYHRESKNRAQHSYRKQYQQPRDYYPQQPQYPRSPVHKKVSVGVLGRVLGYEIAKEDGVATELGAVENTYLGSSMLKKR
jgi:hypothetical protein